MSLTIQWGYFWKILWRCVRRSTDKRKLQFQNINHKREKKCRLTVFASIRVEFLIVIRFDRQMKLCANFFLLIWFESIGFGNFDCFTICSQFFFVLVSCLTKQISYDLHIFFCSWRDWTKREKKKPNREILDRKFTEI